MNKRKRNQLSRRKQRDADIRLAKTERRLQLDFHLSKTMTKSAIYKLKKKQRVKLYEMVDMSSPPKDYTKEENVDGQS